MTTNSTPVQPLIFISVASFCDSNLRFTLTGLFEQADNPDALAVAVVDQSDDKNREWIAQQVFAKQIRYVQINPVDSRGVSWARGLAFSLYQGELYFFQIDSHTYFEKGWDTTLIGQLRALLTQVDKPIITTYPPPFNFDEHGKVVVPYSKDEHIYILRPKDGVELKPNAVKLGFVVKHKKADTDFLEGHHIAGGFIFTLGSFVQEVPYDPYMYFHGEEQNLSLRAYTRGYTIFHPRHRLIPLAHLYKQAGEEHRGQHWRADLERQRTFSFSQLMQRSDARLAMLASGSTKLGAFGLGDQRTLVQFCQESGVNYQDYSITEPKAAAAVDYLVTCPTPNGPMIVAKNDVSIGLALRRHGVWAQGLLNMALKYVQPGGTVLEVGSSYGEHAVPIMNKLGDKGRLVAIEPNPVLFKVLSSNLFLNKHLDALPVEAALGDITCTVGVMSINFTQLCNVSRCALLQTKENAIPVQAMSIDDLELKKLDLIKINVNGLDHIVLKGALKTCETLRPVVIVAGEVLNIEALSTWANTSNYSMEQSQVDTFAYPVPVGDQAWAPLLECVLLTPKEQ
jgi:FkbM family methyltransferase